MPRILVLAVSWIFVPPKIHLFNVVANIVALGGGAFGNPDVKT